MIQQCAKCGNEVDVPEEIEPIVSALTSPGKSGPMCPGCFALWHQTLPKQEETVVPVRQSKYMFTPEMDEISGFGGGYEETCRNMLKAGVEWFDAHPGVDPNFRGMKNIYGIILEENEDAKALTKAVIDAADGDCTGAMHQAVISHCLMIKKHGWAWYCDEMRKKDEPKEA